MWNCLKESLCESLFGAHVDSIFVSVLNYLIVKGFGNKKCETKINILS